MQAATASTAAGSGQATRDRWTSWNVYDGGCLGTRLGTRQMLDFTVFSQDSANIRQLGKIDSTFEWREARFSADGELRCFDEPVSFSAAFDFNGFDLPKGQRFGLAHFWIEIPVNRWVGTVTVGNQKPPFSIEELITGGNLTYMERALTAFEVGDKTGVVVANHALDMRLTWALGLFSNWISGGHEIAGTARVTGLPVYASDGARLVHLGLAGRYLSPPDGPSQYKARPATHVGPYFVDTGPFTAGRAWRLDAELLGIWGPLTFQSELLETWTLSSQGANPNLWGAYIKASWFPTGEVLPFSRKSGVPGAVVPKRKWGAAEVAVRWYTNDLDSGPIQGGVMDSLQLGASWYLLDAMFRLDLNYGRAWLHRFGTVGHSGVYGFRLQFQI